MLHFKNGFLREAAGCWLPTEGFEDDGGGDDFGKELGRGVGRGAEKNVGGDTLAAVFLKGGGDGRIAASPVGYEKGYISFTEGGFNFCTRKVSRSLTWQVRHQAAVKSIKTDRPAASWRATSASDQGRRSVEVVERGEAGAVFSRREGRRQARRVRVMPRSRSGRGGGKDRWD